MAGKAGEAALQEKLDKIRVDYLALVDRVRVENVKAAGELEKKFLKDEEDFKRKQEKERKEFEARLAREREEFKETQTRERVGISLYFPSPPTFAPEILVVLAAAPTPPHQVLADREAMERLRQAEEFIDNVKSPTLAPDLAKLCPADLRFTISSSGHLSPCQERVGVSCVFRRDEAPRAHLAVRAGILLRVLRCSLSSPQGHPVCQPCRNRPEVRHCPTCRQRIVGRATLVEKIAAQVVTLWPRPPASSRVLLPLLLPQVFTEQDKPRPGAGSGAEYTTQPGDWPT